ncbi:MAG: M1 family metallopeptidase, partial [Thermoanaerobaculia bacterium]
RVAQVTVANAKLVESDERFGMHRFALERPLAPGAKTQVRFDLHFANGTFDDDTTIVANGSLLMTTFVYPTLGYRRSYEITDPRERRKHGLPAGNIPTLDDEHGTPIGDTDLVDFAATVSTSRDQIAIAPGQLERSWEEHGRRYFRYQSDAPIPNRFAIASGRFDVVRRKVGHVLVELYSHPGHPQNIDRMLAATSTTLAYAEQHFGRYPWNVLRVVEVPSYWPFGGFAMPTLILMREDRAFLTDARNPRNVDLVTRRTAHEVLHQWFGHQLIAAVGEGSSAITESLTKYGELMVMEQLYGKTAVRNQLGYELTSYLRGRSNEQLAEVPLWKARGQAYLYYGKGSLVTYALRDLLGEARMNAAIRGLVDQFRGVPDRATTRDLLAHLRRVANDEEYALIQQWLTEIVLYDLQIEEAKVVRGERGYEVRMRVRAAKSKTDGEGRETPVPMDEEVEIALFDQDHETVIASQKARLRNGMNEVVIVTPKPPTIGVIDPYFTRVGVRPRNHVNM